MPEQKPNWLKLSEEIAPKVLFIGLNVLNPVNKPDLDVASMPYCAPVHLAQCIDASWRSNLKGHHSVAVCLIRQCVESLTIVDCGLQADSFAISLLADWKVGKKKTSDIRIQLEKHVWPRYGTGLWSESWAEFFGNLARAVQPYARFSGELMGWQFSLDAMADGVGIAEFGPRTYDPLNASRITLFQSIIQWALGRLLLATGHIPRESSLSFELHFLGEHLSRSKLLFADKPWEVQLMPQMWFKDGSDWREE
jgi:hypothetical protein